MRLANTDMTIQVDLPSGVQLYVVDEARSAGRLASQTAHLRLLTQLAIGSQLLLLT